MKREFRTKYDQVSFDCLGKVRFWGADISFRELISMHDECELITYEVEKKYNWSKQHASKLIESILFGFPIPNVCFAKVGPKELIIDGYQRILTVHDFVRTGIFTPDNTEFRLINVNKQWRGKNFSELKVEEQRKILSTTIHVIIFDPGDTGTNKKVIDEIYERINS